MQKPSRACRKSTMLFRESLFTYSRMVWRNCSLFSLYRLVRQFWAWGGRGGWGKGKGGWFGWRYRVGG